MSIYGDLVCTDCKVIFWLGKAVFLDDPGEEKVVSHFHVGGKTESPNWAREELNQALWKFLEEHKGHSLRVLFDYELEGLQEKDEYREVRGIARGHHSGGDG